MGQQDPHADRYPAPPAWLNNRAVSPPALERMVADQVEVTITFGDGSAYAAVFGPCWADLGTMREGAARYDPPITSVDDLRALPALRAPAFGLELTQRIPANGPVMAAPPLGTIRTVTPGEGLGARYAALAAERAALIEHGAERAELTEPLRPAGVDPATALALLDGLRQAVAAGHGWQVSPDAAVALLAIVEAGGPA
jgi:hypothetical protein